MANRSYIYLKNGDEVRVLAEGIYSIPYFWQLFWNEEDLQAAIDLWKKVEELEKELGDKLTTVEICEILLVLIYQRKIEVYNDKLTVNRLEKV